MRNMSICSLILINLAVLFMVCSDRSASTKDKDVVIKTEIGHDRLISRLEKEIPDLMEKALIPGLSISLIREGKLLWHKGFGVENADTGEPVTDKTIFESASTGKPVFAYAVMKLVEKGKLDLDTPLIHYAPVSYLEKVWEEYNTPDKRFRQITARMVLNHSTGFPNWLKNRLYFEFNPGEKWGYSGSGYVLLGTVVEKIMGQSLEDFINQEVLKPLGMTDSWFCWLDKFEKQASEKHNFLGRPTPRHKYLEPMAAGSLYTTAKDYAKFLLAIINDEGLSKQTMVEMLKPQIKAHRKEKEVVDIFWGLGFALHKTGHGYSIWHHGDNGDCKAYFELFKKNKTGFVYFTNSRNGLSIADVLARIILDSKMSALSKFADYPCYDSPEIRFYHSYIKKGADEAINLFTQLEGNPATAGSITTNVIINLAREGLIRKDPEGALNLTKTAIEVDPHAAEAYTILGEIYSAQGNNRMAIKNYKKSLELNPNNMNVKEILKKIEPN